MWPCRQVVRGCIRDNHLILPLLGFMALPSKLKAHAGVNYTPTLGWHDRDPGTDGHSATDSHLHRRATAQMTVFLTLLSSLSQYLVIPILPSKVAHPKGRHLAQWFRHHLGHSQAPMECLGWSLQSTWEAEGFVSPEFLIISHSFCYCNSQRTANNI